MRRGLWFMAGAGAGVYAMVRARRVKEAFTVDGLGGAFVTGATVANFAALAAARHVVLERAGWNVEADGLFGAPPIQVIVGAEVHPSLVKSLGLLGLGRNRVVRVPVDGQGRMRADALPRIATPAIVCTQAGNVNTGAIDPVGEICDRVAGSGAWVHVDGAFGLWAAASPALATMTRGVEKADSWATDAHKWLNVPYDCGLAFSRDAEALRAAMAVTAEYLPSVSPFRNPADYTPELSRRWHRLCRVGAGACRALCRGARPHRATPARLPRPPQVRDGRLTPTSCRSCSSPHSGRGCRHRGRARPCDKVRPATRS